MTFDALRLRWALIVPKAITAKKGLRRAASRIDTAVLLGTLRGAKGSRDFVKALLENAPKAIAKNCKYRYAHAECEADSQFKSKYRAREAYRP
jgi:hypothetical protein